MSSLEFAPPMSCCGGLAFHETWCARDETGAVRRASFKPSAFRFRWSTAPTVKETAAGWLPQMEQGHGFRAIRVMYGLTLREVAAGWRVSDVEVGELERGHRHFTTPADMHAALQQLWCWANEKRPSISAAPAPVESP